MSYVKSAKAKQIEAVVAAARTGDDLASALRIAHEAMLDRELSLTEAIEIAAGGDRKVRELLGAVRRQPQRGRPAGVSEGLRISGRFAMSSRRKPDRSTQVDRFSLRNDELNRRMNSLARRAAQTAGELEKARRALEQARHSAVETQFLMSLLDARIQGMELQLCRL